YHYGFTTLFLFCGGLSVAALLVAGAVRLPPVSTTAGKVRPALFERSSLEPSLVMFFVTFTYGGVVTFIALHGAELGIVNVGFYFTAFALAVMATRPLCGMLYDRRGHRIVVIPGLLCIAAGAAALALATDLTGFVAAAVVGGAGLGATHPTLQALIFARCAPNRRGAASASFATAFDLGVGGGAVLLGLFSQFMAYREMYLFAAGAPLLGLLVYLASVGRRGKTHC
ncbi:MAG: MFS transporter, partial [Candidatus Desulforudis sp.]|nr:MFS transporter [Desulforudis sp.]